MMLPKEVTKTALVVFVIALLGLWSSAYAQEHPEHPAEHQAEHPTSEKAAMTKEGLAVAIEKYVNEDAALKGGYFLFFDTKESKALALKLDKVHKERLSQLSDGIYFACADFMSMDGVMYDLDIFMKGPSVDDLTVTEITVHKLDGKARYVWVKEGDFWKRK